MNRTLDLPPTPAAAPGTEGADRIVATGYLGAALLVGTITVGCMWTANHLTPSAGVHAVALFAHLAALVAGFGAVLAVDWMALLWLAGRRPIEAVLDTAASIAVPIWIGYAGLVGTGMLLEPDMSRPWTLVKLGLVVVIGINGVAAAVVHRAMVRQPSRAAVVLGAACASVSQGCWWTATVVGFVNAH